MRSEGGGAEGGVGRRDAKKRGRVKEGEVKMKGGRGKHFDLEISNLATEFISR